MNKEAYKIISDELSRLLIGSEKRDILGNVTWIREPLSVIYWSMWRIINKAQTNKKITTSEYRDLTNKLMVFTEYIISA